MSRPSQVLASSSAGPLAPMGSGSCGKEAWVRLSGCRCLRGRAGGGPGGTRPRPGAGEVIVAEHPSFCSRAHRPLELVSVNFHSLACSTSLRFVSHFGENVSQDELTCFTETRGA